LRLTPRGLLLQDNLDPQSRSTLRVRVVCTGSLLLASLRCFVRVNGVAARVVDTRYLLRPDSVLRARSWREGRWAELAGEGAPSHVDLGPDEDSLAAARLPVVRPPLTELLRLPTAARPGRGGEGGGEGGGGGRGGRGRGLGGAALEPRWRRAFGGELEGVSVDGTRVVVAHSEGGVERLELSGGGRLWLSALRHGAAAAAVALSPSEADGGRLAVGGRGGEVEVWRAESGDLLASVSVVPAGPRRAVAVSNWVEWLSWRGDGGALGCAAGRCVALLSSGGEVVARREASGQVAALAFVAGEFKRVDEAAEAGAGWRGRLAVGTYGGVEWLCAGGAPAESLALGGGAVRRSRRSTPCSFYDPPSLPSGSLPVRCAASPFRRAAATLPPGASTSGCASSGAPAPPRGQPLWTAAAAARRHRQRAHRQERRGVRGQGWRRGRSHRRAGREGAGTIRLQLSRHLRGTASPGARLDRVRRAGEAGGVERRRGARPKYPHLFSTHTSSFCTPAA